MIWRVNVAQAAEGHTVQRGGAGLDLTDHATGCEHPFVGTILKPEPVLDMGVAPHSPLLSF